MTKINLSDLEAKANAATPGPWTHENMTDIVWKDGESIAIDFRPEDASFTASMNPQTALALIRISKAVKEYLDGSEHRYECRIHDGNKGCDCGYAELSKALEGVE